MEIERKWLLPRSFDVKTVPKDVCVPVAVEFIQQGYLVITDESEIRVRRSNTEYTITVKSNGDLVREEQEEVCSRQVFDLLHGQTKGLQISKTRHSFVLPSLHTLEIDVFMDSLSGLILVECEFDDKITADAFVLPSFFAGAVDVTADKRYKNKNLALKPSAIQDTIL